MTKGVYEKLTADTLVKDKAPPPQFRNKKRMFTFIIAVQHYTRSVGQTN